MCWVGVGVDWGLGLIESRQCPGSSTDRVPYGSFGWYEMSVDVVWWVCMYVYEAEVEARKDCD